MKSFPWTDGQGPQEENSESVTEWCNFHNLLFDNNSSKLEKKVRDTILKFQCYGLSKDLVKSLKKDKLNSEYGAIYVVISIHKRDPLSFATAVCPDFNELLSTGSQPNEYVKNFKTPFEAQLSRCNATRAGTIPESLLSLMIIANVVVKDNQRVSILVALVKNIDSDSTVQPSVS